MSETLRFFESLWVSFTLSFFEQLPASLSHLQFLWVTCSLFESPTVSLNHSELLWKLEEVEQFETLRFRARLARMQISAIIKRRRGFRTSSQKRFPSVQPSAWGILLFVYFVYSPPEHWKHVKLKYMEPHLLNAPQLFSSMKLTLRLTLKANLAKVVGKEC